MGLQGTLETMLLGWISRRRSAGKLSLQGGTVSKSLTLDGGLVINAASNDPDLQALGALHRDGQPTEGGRRVAELPAPDK